MKKTILSIGLAAMLLGSNLFAAENDSLTRATVKLIKNYNNLEQKINNIDNGNMDNGFSVKKAQESIDLIQKENTNTISVINENRDKISKLEYSVKDVEKVANGAKSTAVETQKLVNEMRGISNNFKSQTNEVVGSAKVAYQKSTINETKVDSMSVAVEKNAKETKENIRNISTLTTSLSALADQFNTYKFNTDKEIENLNAKINNSKMYSEAEIKVLKTKLDRTKPVYLLDKTNSKLDCTGDKCQDDSDKVINNFIK